MAVPISLEEFAWDRDNFTLTIPFRLVSTRNWAHNNTITIKSHVTEVEYEFKWLGSGYYNSCPKEHWILMRQNEKCPIEKVFLVVGQNKGEIFKG